jgi:predicted 3-demethylubiquinone-9 3-methyltransferase (glyoxalase superfamily)
MQKIIPHLWFDTQAKTAAELYTSVIPNSKITNIYTLHDTPSGDTDIVSFTLANQPFLSISAGPYFTFNPSVSFHIKCKTEQEVDAIWNKLIEGGHALMELGSYPFSKRYGWLTDKYGLSWQIIHAGDQPFSQTIIPVLMYTGPVAGKAEDAGNYYASVFAQGNFTVFSRYGNNEGPDKEGTVRYGALTIEGMEFGLMDSGRNHSFNFNEAASFVVNCRDQKEIDYFWEKLSVVADAEQCGWCKDKFGVSWQIVPATMEDMMRTGSKEQIDRVTKAFLSMKKFNIAELEKAFSGSKNNTS